MVWLVLAAGLVLTAVTGAPIGVGLGLTGLALLHFLAQADLLAVTAVWNVFTDFNLSAVPVFIFMGEILLASGISQRLYNGVSPLFQRIPGKLLHTNIVVCTLFGAINGSSMSTAAAVGSVAYPELRDRGYERTTIVATLAAGGTLGLLIPPSLSLLIYGAVQQVSIGKLFLAGIFPGLMLAAMMLLIIAMRCLGDRALTPETGHAYSLRERLVSLLGIWPLGILVLAVLGTIYLGLATPTEAAGLGVLTTVLIGFTWGDLTFGRLRQAFVSSVVTFGTIGSVVLGALILAQAISILGLPTQLMGAITDLTLPKYAVLALVVLAYLILGCFFDGISLLLMTVPIVYPVMTALGFDPVWLGVMVTILIEIGLITPPVGLNLFVLVAITHGEVNVAEAARAALPFWLAMLFAVAVLAIFPQIALVLPRLVM